MHSNLGAGECTVNWMLYPMHKPETDDEYMVLKLANEIFMSGKQIVDILYWCEDAWWSRYGAHRVDGIMAFANLPAGI